MKVGVVVESSLRQQIAHSSLDRSLDAILDILRCGPTINASRGVYSLLSFQHLRKCSLEIS